MERDRARGGRGRAAHPPGRGRAAPADEQIQRTVERATAAYADEAAQQFAALVKSSREDAARRLAARARPRGREFAREAEVVLAERLAHVGDAGAQRLEQRLADAAKRSSASATSGSAALDGRIGELRRTSAAASRSSASDADAERAVIEARLQELVRRIDAAAAVQSPSQTPLTLRPRQQTGAGFVVGEHEPAVP